MPTDDWPRLEPPPKGWFVATRMLLAVRQDDQGRTILGPNTRMPLHLWVIEVALAAIGLGIVAIPFWLKALDVIWSIMTVGIGVIGIGGIFLPPIWVRRRARRAGPILRRGPGDDGYELPRLNQTTRADQTCRLAEVEGLFTVGTSRGSRQRYRAFQIFLIIEDTSGVSQLLLYTGARAMPEEVRQRIQAELNLPIDTFNLGPESAVKITGVTRLI